MISAAMQKLDVLHAMKVCVQLDEEEAAARYTLLCVELPCKDDRDANHLSDFDRLTPEEQVALRYWIGASIMLASNYDGTTSYGMKHDFEREGFYITNGQFKGAMVLSGYTPKDFYVLNWTFKVKHRVSRRFRGHSYYDLSDQADHYSLGCFDLEYAQLLAAAGKLKERR